MLFILNESKATKIFENYRNVAAFTLSKSVKGATLGDLEVSYEKLTFLPDEDTINAIKAGDMKLKKVINKAIKALYQPSMDNATIGLGMTQLVTILTSNRKAKRGPAVIVFVTDEEDKARNKILVKYLTALLNEYGLNPITKEKVVKDLFKKRKKAKDKVIAYSKKGKSGCNLNKKGVELKRLNQVFYELELRQSSMVNMDLRDLDGSAAEACTKSLLKVYTAENLKFIGKKTAKKLAKKNKIAVEAYKDLAEIMASMNGDFKMPKVKYGQKKKKGKAVGPKMNTKKFKKFFEKKRNRGMLLLVYAHTVTMLLGLEIGTKEYNAYMKGVCGAFRDDFAKEFVTAANAYAKNGAKG